MKVALTGASGYLGQLVLPLLDKHQGVESILGLDIVPCPFSSPRYTFQTADMRTADFKALLKGVDALYHLAFVVEPPKRMKIETIDEINIEGSRRVLQGAVAAGVSKIVFASSIAAYGAHADNPEVLTEDSPLRPNQDWYYSRAKGEIEAFLDELQGQHPEMAIIRFRPSTFLGPCIRNPVGVLYASRVLVGLKKGYRIDHCWDEDAAEAFVLALGYPGSGTFKSGRRQSHYPGRCRQVAWEKGDLPASRCRFTSCQDGRCSRVRAAGDPGLGRRGDARFYSGFSGPGQRAAGLEAAI